MKGPTTAPWLRIARDVPDVATPGPAASARKATAAVVLAAATLLSGCATTALPALAGASPAVPTSAPPHDAPSPAASRPAAATPRVPLRAATPAPVAPRDPAPRFLTVEGTSISMAIVEVSVSADGAMEIPDTFHQAGWYRHGPAPGAAAGAAVVAGHVDTASDRAPLSQLNGLAAGTRITIERDAAPALKYRVRSVELMAKDKFDGGSLFRRDGPHQLKLVTCGGRWLDARQDYSDNVIVTADLE